MGGWVDGWRMGGWIDIDGWIDGWMDGWMRNFLDRLRRKRELVTTQAL
jgi:hypothetical protein